MSLEDFAERLFQAHRQALPIPQLTNEKPSITPAEAYDVQALLVARWEREGTRSVGRKAGLTSIAKQREVGVDSAIFGHLLSNAEIANGGRATRSTLIHPRAEPEIVFMLSRPVAPDEPEHLIREAIRSTHIGIELIDSRFRDFKFTLPDVIADNCSAAGWIIGDEIEAPLSRLPTLGVWIRRSGEVLQTGAGAAILGDPVRSLIELVRQSKEPVPAGPVLAGGVTQSVTIQRGDFVEVECGTGARASFRLV